MDLLLRRLLPALVFLFVACLAAGSGAASLNGQEQRGKIIYFQGKSPSEKPITAYFGKDLLEMPGESATCGSCHGYDGLGRPESGVIPTNITWDYLFKSYGHIHPDGVEHGPFTLENLKSYMRDGVYPGGKKGDPSMPVYDISDQDLDDLLAFMKRLGTESEPGLSENEITIGMLVPADGALAPMGEAMEKTVAAYFAYVNERGGIYGRTLQLSVRRTVTMSPDSFADMLREKQVFALVSPFVPGFDDHLPQICAAEKIPAVGPFTLFPVNMMALNKQVFYLYPGIREQAAALIDFSASKLPLKKPHMAVVFAGRENLEGLAQEAEERGAARGWRVSKRKYQVGSFSARTLVSELMKKKTDLVLFLGHEEETRAFLDEASKKSWYPYVLSSGVFLGKGAMDIPPGFKEKAFLAYPTLPEDRKDWGVAELSRVLGKEGVAVTHLSAQIAAYASAKVLVEGLRQSGRDLSRERFILSLEKLYEFDTGLTPPITFNRNRHIGAPGAYVVTVDPGKKGTRETITSKGWITAR